ncbi:MAG: choice-of-anchor N protein [Desulfosoma sp.]
MQKRLMMALLLVALAMMPTTGWAVPILQLGAPAGPGDTGLYADYNNWSNPPEEETARTSGYIIYAAASYGVNNQTLLIGGQYTGSSGTGKDWYDDNAEYSFGFDASFKDAGAILLVSIYTDNATFAYNNLKLDRDDDAQGAYGAFYYTDTSLNTLSWWPSQYNDVRNHAPVPSANAYLFFDIGNFTKSTLVPDFSDESTGNDNGSIKTLTLSGLDSPYISWAHFDLLAIVTDLQGQSMIRSTLENNPFSHDVTWDPNGGGPPNIIPEPATLFLFGTGLAGSVAWLRKKRKN